MTPEYFQELIAFLKETPGKVIQLTSDLTVEERIWRPSADAFSALEQVCHLRDIEQEGYATRIDKLLRLNRPALADIDGSRLAAERAYNQQDIGRALEAFIGARLGSINRLLAVPLNKLGSIGVLEGVGEVTLGELVRLMREHDQAHLDELQELRSKLEGRLGR